jgi:hypothetical protein
LPKDITSSIFLFVSLQLLIKFYNF